MSIETFNYGGIPSRAWSPIIKWIKLLKMPLFTDVRSPHALIRKKSSSYTTGVLYLQPKSIYEQQKSNPSLCRSKFHFHFTKKSIFSALLWSWIINQHNKAIISRKNLHSHIPEAFIHRSYMGGLLWYGFWGEISLFLCFWLWWSEVGGGLVVVLCVAQTSLKR